MAGKWPTTATDADLYIAVNELQNNLASAINNAVTSVPLNSATSFPTVGLVLIDNEVIKYTGISTNTLTGCTRAFDGTTAAAHSSSAVVSFAFMAAHHNVLKDEMEAVEADLATILTTLTPATPGATATSLTNRWSQLAQQLINIAGTTHWYDSIPVSLANMLPLAGGTVTGNMTVGSGGTAASNILFVLNGSNASSSGYQLRFQSNSVLKATLGKYGSIFGTSSEDLDIALGSSITFRVTESGGNDVVIAGSSGTAILGVTTNTAATAGYVGQRISSAIGSGSAVSSTGNNNLFDVTSISLTAGDWEVWGQIEISVNGATFNSGSYMDGGISTTSGNNAAGLTYGDTRFETYIVAAATNANETNIVISAVQMLLSGTTTVYLKCAIGFSGGTPKAYGKIVARRMR